MNTPKSAAPKRIKKCGKTKTSEFLRGYKAAIKARRKPSGPHSRF